MTQSDVSDPFAAKLLATVSQWDFVADADSFGTIIWLRWMDEYRKATWDDEWTARGIEKQGGSWGFSGDNRREPMLEVLEFITREIHPDGLTIAQLPSARTATSSSEKRLSPLSIA